MRFATIFTALFAAVAIAAPTPDDPISDALGRIPGPFGDIASGISSGVFDTIGNLISVPRDIAGTILGLPRDIASEVWGNLTPWAKRVALEKYVVAQQQQPAKTE